MTPAPVASNPVLRRVLIVGGVVTAGIAVILGVIGFFVAAGSGLSSALLGVVLGAMFLAITAASILIANRWNGDPIYPTLFYAIVLGGWLVKFVVFIVVLMLVRGAPWLHEPMFFVGIIVSVIATLVVDVIVMKSMRIPYVSDIELPGEGDSVEPSHPTGVNPASPEERS